MIRQGIKAKIQEMLPGHHHRDGRPAGQDDA